jgi:methionyl-tRNA formyltransferase
MVRSAAFRIVFFGTPEFAVPTLSALIASNHLVAAVVTQPDKPSGRGQRLQPSPIKTLALANNIAVFQPERLRDPLFLDTFAALNADVGIVAAYGKILTDAVLQVPARGFLNVHASLLPKYRGAAPIHRAVIAGETVTGVTIMRVVKALDAGPMLAAVSHPIGPDDTSVDVERELAQIGATALVRVLDRLDSGELREVPQDESQATYARKLQKSDGIIDWNAPARVIHDQIRGLHPWPHAFTDLDGARCLLLQSRVYDGVPPAPAAAIGSIVEARGDILRVQTGDGVLDILRLQLEGRRALATREFLSGRRIAPGTLLTRSSL